MSDFYEETKTFNQGQRNSWDFLNIFLSVCYNVFHVTLFVLRTKYSHNQNLELYLHCRRTIFHYLTLQKVIAVQDLEPLVTPCHISEWILHVPLTLYLGSYEGNFCCLCVFLWKYFHFRPKAKKLFKPQRLFSTFWLFLFLLFFFGRRWRECDSQLSS